MRCELSLRAITLPIAEGASRKSELIAVVTQIATTPGDQPKCLGRTEEVANERSPRWKHKFQISWNLGTPMKFCVHIFEKEAGKKKFRPRSSATFDVEQILGFPGCRCAKKLKGGGVLVAFIRKGTGPELRLKLKGLRLRSIDGFMRRPDPCYEIHRRTENEEGFIDWELVYRSTKIMDNANPVWPSIAIDTLSLGDGNLNHPLKIILFHHKKDGNNENIGEVQVSVNRLIDASTEGNDDPSRALSLTLIKSKTTKIKTGRLVVLQAYIRGADDTIEEKAGLQVRRGSVVVENAKEGPNFLDYVINGCYFNVVLAVDFSGSNGDPNKPGTLHYLDLSGGFNDYEKPMIAMLSILGQLETDNHFALWGFGAKYNDKVHNIFQCGTSRLIRGIDGVLQAYRDQFRSGITMTTSPTVFTDVIRMAAARAERDAQIAEKFEKQVYTILCILTGRDVEFIEDTAAALDEATSTPLSVVFVGIGDGDFFNMRFIDHGREMRNMRDIAHFVAFDEHSKDSQAFTSEACQEIPQQVTDFFESKGIAPLPEIELSDDDLMRMPADDESDVVIHLTKENVPKLKGGGIEYRDLFRYLLGADDK